MLFAATVGMTLRSLPEMLPPYVADHFGRGAEGLATLASTMGCAALIGGLAVAVRGRMTGLGRIAVGCGLILALATAGFVATHVFAIGVISGSARYVFEYDPSGCRFTRVDKPGPLSAYVAALECHAADLLAYLRCEIMPSALMFGRVRRWRGGNENFTSAVDQAIWLYAHPLRRPAAYLDLYRSLYAREPKDVPHVRAR